MVYVAGFLICLVVLYLAAYVLHFMAVWLGDYPILGLVVAVVLLIIYGVIGNDLGLANHFHPDVVSSEGEPPGAWLRRRPTSDEWTQFSSGLAVMGLFTLVAVLAGLLDRCSSLPPGTLPIKLSIKRDRLVGPFRELRNLFVWMRWVPWRILDPSSHPRRVPAVPAGPREARLLASQLIFRPCRLLAVLAAGAAFAEIWGTWVRRFDQEALSHDLERVAWWWLIGLAAGTLMAWGVARLVAQYLHSAPPTRSRTTIRALVALILAAFLGVALRFRSAGDLVEVGGSSPVLGLHGWRNLFLVILAGAPAVGLMTWSMRRLREPPGEVTLLRTVAERLAVGLIGFGVIWLAARLCQPDRPLLVSATLCAVLGLVAAVYADFQTVSVTRRLAVTVLLFALLFAANGTSWDGPRTGPADDYKLKFDGLYRQGIRRASYYDYPVLLDSKEYLDRSYLHPVSITDASNTSPIVVTSAHAQRLRTGDRVRVTDVRGNAAANGTFVVVTDGLPRNQFALDGSAGSGRYTFGGEWIEDLEGGRILDVRTEVNPAASNESQLLLTSYDHGLRDRQTIALVDVAGNPIGDRPSFVVRTRPEDDARSGAQFFLEGVDMKAGLSGRLASGRWYPVTPETHQGGVAWVTRFPASWSGRAPGIVISALDPHHAANAAIRDHGVRTGQRVLIEDVVANPEANGVWTVHRINRWQFALLNPAGEPYRVEAGKFQLPPPDPGDAPPAAGDRSELMSGGSWKVVTDRGRISDASNDPGKPIRILSLGHGLRDGDHVDIVGIRGNTRANGLWTVRRVSEGDAGLRAAERRRVAGLLHPSSDPARQEADLLALMPAAFELIGPDGRPLQADGQPEFDYRSGGEWKRVPYRGRIFAVKSGQGGEVRVYSPGHRLRPGTAVELGGISFDPPADGPRPDAAAFKAAAVEDALNGQIFRVSAAERDWFDFEPTTALPPGPDRPVSGVVAEWTIVYGRGPTLTVVKDTRTADLRIQSPDHGLRSGDRVHITGTPWGQVGAVGIYAVEVEPACEDCFSLRTTRALAAPRFDVRTAVTGRWQRVSDTGTFKSEGSTDRPHDLKAEGRPIALNSPAHGLTSGDRVTITGPTWAEDLRHAATFTVADSPEVRADAFLLAGTGALRVSEAGGSPGTAAPPTWRRLDRLGRPNNLLIAEAVIYDDSDPTHPLVLTSRGHGLKSDDRVRVERIGLKNGAVALGERFADTFAVKRVGEDSFRIAPYDSWKYPIHEGPPDRKGGLSSISLIRQSEEESRESGRALLCAWRPILDRGVVDRVEIKELTFRARNGDRPVPASKVRRRRAAKGILPAIYETMVEDRPLLVTPRALVWIDSRRHGLAPGAWVFITRHDALRGGPFKVVEAIEDAFCVDAYGGLLEPGSIEPDPMARWTVAGLLDDQEVLANWSDTLQGLWYSREELKKKQVVAPPPAIGRGGGLPEASGPAPKPKLAIVTVSGGGIRSAVWTASVLEKLESELADFPYHTRLITGASGGMLGAAYYVSTLEPPELPDAAAPPPPDVPKPVYHPDPMRGDRALPLVKHLARDHLSRVANQLAFSDLPSMLWPKPWGTDRGQALEKTWWWNTNPDPDRGPFASPLARSMRGLAVGEWQGWRPSLIFTPMFVEDGRRLLISNLNLEFAPRNIGHVLFARGTDKLSRSTKRVAAHLQNPVGDSDIYSLSAVEFFRLFPEAHNLRLSTAARMSAAFPLVTPAVSLPTIPPRRVVDAGYYDNYGVNLAALWVFQNRRWLFEYTSGVVLVQVRDSQSEHGRRELADPEPDPTGGLLTRLLRLSPVSGHALDLVGDVAGKADRGSQWLTSPLEGLSAARQANMSFRNDEQVEVLSNVINPIKGPGFCTTVVFECPKEASLSWALTARERTEIEAGFEPDHIDPAYSEGARRNAERLRMLIRWWGR